MSQLTEVLWGTVNIFPTLVLAIALYVAPSFTDYDRGGMIAWLITIVVTFAVIFAVNSSIHSYLVVKYAKREKVAVSVGETVDVQRDRITERGRMVWGEGGILC